MRPEEEAFAHLIVSGTYNYTGWPPIPLHIICSLADHQLALLYA